MYCKLFSSLYQGTLRGRAHEILVFTNLLANCDASGYVDKHFRAIADEVGITQPEVEAAIKILESPDLESRSPEENGSRIKRIDDHRVWGWRIVNYGKYRAIKNEDDRREQNRLAQEKWRNRHKQPVIKVSSVSRGKPPSAQAEAEAEAEEIKSKKARSAPFARPSIEAVKLQAAKIGVSDTEAEKFFNYYESNGWRVGRNPMKSWPSAFTNWKSNIPNYGQGKNHQKPNPRNIGVIVGPTDYGTAKPRYQREQEEAERKRLAGQMAADENNSPST